MLSSASIFETLPQRPPTPPRDLAAEKEEDSRTIEHAIDFLENDYDFDSAERHDQTLESKAASDFAAPEQSPSSSQDPSNSTKRVEFSPFPKFHQIARLGQIISPSHQLSKRSPLNRHAKPRRSILKQSSYVLDPPTPDELENTLSYFSPQDPSSFAKMLQSVIQHLSGQRQDARLDGYLALNGAIKAYDGVVPDVQALASKMDIIMQFLARDIVCKTPSGTLDTNMVTQSLKLVAAIMFVPTLMESWDDDFRAFLIDRSATVMESTDVAKAIVKMHMFILAHQRFRSSSVLTSARAERIITTLQTIEDRCSGNTTVASRLIIYTRLLDQAPAVMMARSRDWLEHTFHGMLSSIKEIRIRAIELCQAAGLVLGQHPHGVKPIRDMLETEMEEGKTYGEYLNDRMLQMVSDPETGVFVPQIWAAVLLFFRYKRSQVERWPRFRTWLMIIQKCLNSSDINIKYAANRAWNKMVFVMMPDESMSSTMKTMLRAPVAAGFRRRNHDRHAQEERQIAAETYYNLLHYCLRPGLNHQEIDCAWDSYVDTILPERCKASIKGRSMALQTIRGLLTTTAGTWNFNAANESEPIKPEDLPKLDPRWVRSRLSKVLNVLEPAISDSMFKVPKLNIELDATLQALYTSIAEAGNQEVRSSIELKEAVAVLVNLLRKLWLEGTTVPTENIPMFIKRYHSLILDAARIIGPSSFAEDILTKMKDDDKDIVFTPSHRPSKHHVKPYPPLLSLFLGLHTTPAVFAVAGQEEILSLGRELVDLLIAPKPSPTTKIELLGRLVHACSLDAQFTSDSALSALLWTCIGTCTSQILATQTVQSNSSNVNTLGHQLRGVSAVLTAGLSFTSEYPACINNILTLYDTAISLARSQAGTAGAAMAITEPCASRLKELPTEVPVAAKLPFASHMLRSSVWPRSQHELDRAQKALWNVSLSSNKSSVFEPFVKTSQMATQFLASAYGSFDSVVPSDGVDTTLQFLESTMAFLMNCPQILLATTLGTIQHGFVCWVEDRRSKTSNETLSTKICAMWAKLLDLVNSMSLRNSELVQVLEPLLIAGFSSPHRGVVSDTIQFWNQKADHLQTLSYPPKLEAVLRARCVEADINLPEFPIYDGHSLIPELPAFYQIGDNFLHPSGSTRSSMRLVEERGKEIWLSHVKANGNIPVTSENNSGSLPKNPAPPTTKSRLRHEDSQIEFAPIESSPPGRDDEPQHLTEHQQERLAQQKHRAQMFPDLSSSPLPEPINRPNCISKRLDFTSDALSTNDDEAMGTPLALLDGHGIMSDDLPSSPTSSRSKEYSERAYLQNRSDEDDATDHIVDPPSSPPRSHDQVLDNHGLTTIDQDELGGNVGVADQHDDSTVVNVPVSLVERQEERLHEEDVGVLENEDTYFPSDSILPSAQLQAEEQAAVAAIAIADETTGLIQDAGDVQPDRNDDVDVTATVSDLPEIPDELADTTRVEDSFGVTAAVEDVDHTDGQPLDVDRLSPDPDTDQTPRKSRKRKRTAGIVYTAKPAKKRKPQSPFKAVASFFSSYLSQSQEQENEDDDIGDEIVVASSQPSYSPKKPIMSPLAVAEDKFDIDAIRSTEDIPAEIVEEASLHARQPLTTSALACLKWKASELGSDTVDADGTIIDETSTGRTRSGRRRQIASQQSSIDGDTSSAKSTLRRLASVDIPRNDAVGMATSQSATREAAQAEKANAPDAAVKVNITSNLHNRKIATPKSIMSRIRNVIDDLRKSVLGEREASDLALMLCEVSNEIHEAKKRGISG